MYGLHGLEQNKPTHFLIPALKPPTHSGPMFCVKCLFFTNFNISSNALRNAAIAFMRKIGLIKSSLPLDLTNNYTCINNNLTNYNFYIKFSILSNNGRLTLLKLEFLALISQTFKNNSLALALVNKILLNKPQPFLVRVCKS